MLRVENLCHQFGRRLLFERLSLSLEAGQALYLLGANGSGKTTLLGLLGGLITAKAGRIHWQGAAIEELAGRYRSQYLWLGVHSGMKPELTVHENIAVACSLMGDRPPSASSACYATLNLGHLRLKPYAQLSSGERARVRLCPMVHCSRPLWLLDEPAAHLDQEGAGIVDDLLCQHTEAGGIAVCATHRLPKRLAAKSRFLHLCIEAP